MVASTAAGETANASLKVGSATSAPVGPCSSTMPAAQGPNPEPDRIPPDQWDQMPLVDAANKVHKHVEGNHLTGMGGTEFQMKPLTLILWWKGEIPPELAAL